MLRNVQPIYADLACGGVALAHNGNLTNALTLRQKLVQQGCLFQSTTDTEVIIHLLAIDSEQHHNRAVLPAPCARWREPIHWSC